MSIHATALVHPGAKLGKNVSVGPYSIIEEDVIIGEGTKIGPHVVIKRYTEIGRDNEVYQFASIGDLPQDLKFSGEETRLVIGDRNRIREFVTYNRGTKGGGGITSIGNDGFFMAYTHIAHDCHIGNHVILANSVQMGGHVHIGDHAVIGGIVGVHQFVRIGEHAMIGGGSAVTQDVPPFTNVSSKRAELHGLNMVGLKRRGFSPEAIAALKQTYKLIFRSGMTMDEAVARVQDEVQLTDEVKYFIDFITSSERGIIR